MKSQNLQNPVIRGKNIYRQSRTFIESVDVSQESVKNCSIVFYLDKI